MSVERRTLLRGLGTAPAVAGFATVSGVAVQAASAAEVPDRFPAPTRTVHLHAVELPRYADEVRLGYGRTPDTASSPGPVIEMLEGESLKVVLHNHIPAATLEALRTDENTPIGVSLHPHGVRYARDSDGTVHTGSWVAPGETGTYVWYARPPVPRRGIPGTAGYWWYHDHVAGTMHGTAGVNSGLFGALIVRRRGDPRPDRTYTTAFGDANELNGRRYPDTDTYDVDNPRPSNTSLIANQGDRVEFVNIALGSVLHTWHLHGHAWAETRTGMLEDAPWADAIRTVDNKTIGPGDSFGFQVIAGEMSGPGHWMLHCHLQTHSDAGMSTFFHVHDRRGNPPPGPVPGHGG